MYFKRGSAYLWYCNRRNETDTCTEVLAADIFTILAPLVLKALDYLYYPPQVLPSFITSHVADVHRSFAAYLKVTRNTKKIENASSK